MSDKIEVRTDETSETKSDEAAVEATPAVETKVGATLVEVEDVEAKDVEAETKSDAVETKVEPKAKPKRKPKAAKKPSYTKTKCKAVAETSWWKRTSRKKLAETHSLTEEQVDELRATPLYRDVVMQLMVSQRSLEEFNEWKSSEWVKKQFAKRMGIDPKSVPAMMKACEAVHKQIADGKCKAYRVVNNPFAKEDAKAAKPAK